MISLDKVLLLQERVESAVAKIAQLNAENAALRRKCAELTNALSAKTEQFSSFQDDQNKIEEGILKALNRLDVVENEVLKNSVAASSGSVNNSSNQNQTDLQSENIAVSSVTENKSPVQIQQNIQFSEVSSEKNINSSNSETVYQQTISETFNVSPENSNQIQNNQVNQPIEQSVESQTIEPQITLDKQPENSSNTAADTSSPSLFDIF